MEIYSQEQKRAILDLALPRLKESYPSARNPDPRQTYFVLYEHSQPLETISFEKAILKRSNPIEKFQEVMGNLENPTIEMIMDQDRYASLENINQVYLEIEQLVWRENRLVELEKSRKELTDALKKVIVRLKGRIVSIV